VTVTATSSNNVSGNAKVSVSSAINHVVLTPNQFTVNTHATQQVTAQAFDVNNHPIDSVSFTWTTKSGGKVSRVDKTGDVTGVAPGDDSVFASAQGKTGGAAVTVKLAPVATVIVVPDSSHITTKKDQHVQLTDTLKDAQGDTLLGRTVTWASSNAAIATVSAIGLVKPGTDTGFVVITATAENDKKGTASVHVTAP
jgi:hypothetical protein